VLVHFEFVVRFELAVHFVIVLEYLESELEYLESELEYLGQVFEDFDLEVELFARYFG
jgi:hypothetical protein